MTDAAHPLRAEGERVWVASATDEDVDAYIRATERSRRRLATWNPIDAYGLPLSSTGFDGGFELPVS